MIFSIQPVDRYIVTQNQSKRSTLRVDNVDEYLTKYVRPSCVRRPTPSLMTRAIYVNSPRSGPRARVCKYGSSVQFKIYLKIHLNKVANCLGQRIYDFARGM